MGQSEEDRSSASMLTEITREKVIGDPSSSESQCQELFLTMEFDLAPAQEKGELRVRNMDGQNQRRKKDRRGNGCEEGEGLSNKKQNPFVLWILTKMEWQGRKISCSRIRRQLLTTEKSLFPFS